ncbi:MAG: DUF402 domain-containing protein [Bacilli bacterium]|nr:DUF402 domain-containing protein [Bacilli bacterium]
MTKIDIISYKHSGELHRVWKNAIKIYEDDEKIIVLNNKVEVIDGDGRKWKTREPAICYFYKNLWFNVICMIKNISNDIYYYCNLSSPFIEDLEGIKYIDYDLDVKLFPNGDILVLDRDEYEFNVIDLNYSNEITEIIEKSLTLVLEKIKNNLEPFNNDIILNLYEKIKKGVKI